MTPTGADAMKEAERLVMELRSAAATTATYHGDSALKYAVAAEREVRDELLAFIRKLVEAQPAAVPSGVQYIGWFAMDGTPLNSGAENALKVRARAPAVPSVGEPPTLSDEQMIKLAEVAFGKYAHEARSLFLAFAHDLLKAGSVHPSAAGAGNAGVRNAE